MRILSLPKNVLAELLRFLSDHQAVQDLAGVLGYDFSVEDAQAALRELAVQLLQEQEGESERVSLKSDPLPLTSQTRRILAALSPQEEEILFRRFGFHDN